MDRDEIESALEELGIECEETEPSGAWSTNLMGTGLVFLLRIGSFTLLQMTKASVSCRCVALRLRP